jgi:hypothetical protein
MKRDVLSDDVRVSHFAAAQLTDEVSRRAEHTPGSYVSAVGSRERSCNEAAHLGPSWKFCECKHGHPSAIFGAPELA